MAVWAIRRSVVAAERDESLFDPSEPTVRLFAPFSAENVYLRSQKGCFTYIDGGEKYFLDTGEWPSVADVLLKRSREQDSVICGIKFRKAMARDLLRHLWRRGVNPGMLRPTMESAAEAARLKWSLEAPLPNP